MQSDLHRELAESEVWRPKPTIGPVSRRVDRYNLSPLSLPTTPAFAKDARVVALSQQLMERIKADTKAGLPDPWIRMGLWQRHPYYSIGHKIKLAFPGFGIATVAFGVYLGLEYVGVIPSGSSKHEHGH